jgi:preprotein translocase subunit SecY
MTTDFVRRAGFTLGALLIYRLGCNIPLPGINFDLIEQMLRTEPAAGLKATLLSTGGLSHLAIFALGITPYVSAAVLLQLAGIIFRRLRRLQSDGEPGRQTLRRLTFGVTIALAAFQSYGVAVALEGINGAVINPGGLYLLSTVATLTAGTVFLGWLSEQMTAFGLGNGIALFLLAGTTLALSDPIVTITELNTRGLLTSNTLLSLIGLLVFTVGAIVAIERARRCFPIEYSPRQIGDRLLENLSANLEIKLNPAGIIPDLAIKYLAPGRPVYLAVYAVLIFVCTLFYAAYVFNPEQAAEDLDKQKGAIRSVAPGEATVAYLDSAVSRTVLFGAVYLVAICLLPDILKFYLHVPFYFGGLPLLILVCTVLDFAHQIRGYFGLARRHAEPGAAHPAEY